MNIFILDEDPVESYRNYYIGEKSHMFSWKNQPTPWWVQENNLAKKALNSV